MRKAAKARLARNIAFHSAHSIWSEEKVARFGLDHATRDVSGDLRDWLLGKGAEGKITFLDKTPANTLGHILVLGLPNGILVVAHEWVNGTAPAATISMCSRFRNRIVGGAGKIRWARVKAVAA